MDEASERRVEQSREFMAIGRESAVRKLGRRSALSSMWMFSIFEHSCTLRVFGSCGSISTLKSSVQ